MDCGIHSLQISHSIEYDIGVQCFEELSFNANNWTKFLACITANGNLKLKSKISFKISSSFLGNSIYGYVKGSKPQISTNKFIFRFLIIF